MTSLVRSPTARILAALAVAAGLIGTAEAGQHTPTANMGPVPPAVLARDANGLVTVRAVRVTTPLRIDGRLDEEVYKRVPAMTDFTQTEPVAGTPATEKTEVWVLFDHENIYVVGRCWETRPDRMIANEMRRDSGNVAQNDNFAWSFDTFYDRRNGFVFQTNPLAGRMDGQATNQDSINFDWNPVWDVASGRFDNGWVIEAAIPFASLRYGPGHSQVWGFQVRRRNIWKNEISYLSPIPAEIGVRGLRPSLSATLVGLEVPPGSRNLEIKPYGITDLTTDVAARPVRRNDPGWDAGLDVKYGITQNLTADFTYNTDFAQVEADEQQVNLTRFNLQFPEKREFFLEGRGIFALAGEGGDTPSLFYSRRIGLNASREVPIEAGGRLTGRTGGFDIAAINVETERVRSETDPAANQEPTNFSVLRVKRDILRRSSIGALVTHRSVAAIGDGRNTAYGLDASFLFYDRLTINSYFARTHTDHLKGDDVSYRGFAEYNGDRYGFQAERIHVGANFNPEVGFVRRDDIRRSYGQLRFSPRPRSMKAVRKFSWMGSMTYIEDGAGRLESREVEGQFTTEFQSSDVAAVAYSANYEALFQPTPIVGVRLPSGGYDFWNARVGYTFGQQRAASGNVTAEYGTFYNGHKTSITVSGARLKFTPRFSTQPSYSGNWGEFDQGPFSTHLVGARITYTATPQMFVSALLQWSSSTDSMASNIRFRWEYHPGSELFVVYNDQRDTLRPGFPDLVNRAVIVKINRLLRF